MRLKSTACSFRPGSLPAWAWGSSPAGQEQDPAWGIQGASSQGVGFWVFWPMMPAKNRNGGFAPCAPCSWPDGCGSSSPAVYKGVCRELLAYGLVAAVPGAMIPDKPSPIFPCDMPSQSCVLFRATPRHPRQAESSPKAMDSTGEDTSCPGRILTK